jgi:DNA-binding IclR family transcriptional regulator
VSAPVLDHDVVVGAVSVSGPVERLTRSPGRRFGLQVVAAAGDLGGPARGGAAVGWTP